jgi:hypothetical protein
MKKLVFLMIMFSGCVTATYLPETAGYNIPQGANLIVLKSTLGPSWLFDEIAKYLIKDGFRIKENMDRMTIESEGKELMEGTLGRFTILIEKSEDGSKATIRPEWSVTESVAAMGNAMGAAIGGFNVGMRPGWEIAAWSRGRPNIVYSYGMKLALNFGDATCALQH